MKSQFDLELVKCETDKFESAVRINDDGSVSFSCWGKLGYDHTFKLASKSTEEFAVNILKILRSEKLKIFCDHKWVRTTKNYLPAKKCVNCGEIKMK